VCADRLGERMENPSRPQTMARLALGCRPEGGHAYGPSQNRRTRTYLTMTDDPPRLVYRWRKIVRSTQGERGRQRTLQITRVDPPEWNEAVTGYANVRRISGREITIEKKRDQIRDRASANCLIRKVGRHAGRRASRMEEDCRFRFQGMSIDFSYISKR